jgi:hypothetical protein
VAADLDGLDRLIAGLSSRFELTIARDQRLLSIPAPDDVNDLAAVASAVHEVNAEVDEIALRRPTLDDAFLALTGQARKTESTTPDLEESRL